MSLRLTSCFILTALSFFLLFCNQKTETKQEQVPEAPTVSPAISKADDAVIIGEQPEPDTLKGSLKAVATGSIGAVNLRIDYHSPAVRKRVVWGGLVPYDQVWVTGAHSATSLQTDGPITIGGHKLPAGKYALFTIPGQKEWTVVVNKNWEQHLADDYSEKEDLARIPVQPTVGPHQERLRYEVKTDGGNKGSIVMRWEKLTLSIPVNL